MACRRGRLRMMTLANELGLSVARVSQLIPKAEAADRRGSSNMANNAARWSSGYPARCLARAGSRKDHRPQRTTRLARPFRSDNRSP